MSRLDELIKELCPDGVEYKMISDISNVSIGEFVKKDKQTENGQYPVFNGGTSNTGFYDDFNRNENKIIISARGANAGFVNRVFTKFWSGNSCYTIDVTDKNINWTFVYYWLKNNERKLLGEQQTGSIPAVSKKQVCEFKLPVPPLEIQEEIVKILDKFTDYVTELQAELQARKLQYEYYRDILLAGNESIPMVALKEIATDIYRGAGIKRDELCKNGIPCVRYGEIYTQYNTWFDECISHTTEDVVSNPKYFEHGDILFAITGESVEDRAKSVAYVGHEKCLAGGDIVVMKHNQNPRYLAHVLSTSYARAQKSKGKVKSKVVHSNVPSIEKITIPLPSLEIQERYANALDNFESVCNDLKIGLPAEIEVRQKQYEYYRDVLLTFAETGSIIDRQTDRT